MAQEIRSAAPWVPERPTLTSLRRAVQSCRGCDLYQDATQGVMGEGPPRARLMLVGEQPGDREDREGHPFVGPAGLLLDRALVAAGIARDQIFVTNAVKHFKWRRGGGKRRLHEKPTLNEARACRPWLEAEARLLRPAAVVALGATAASTLFGPTARVTTQRGRIFASEWAAISSMTVHPSSLLRIASVPSSSWPAICARCARRSKRPRARPECPSRRSAPGSDRLSYNAKRAPLAIRVGASSTTPILHARQRREDLS